MKSKASLQSESLQKRAQGEAGFGRHGMAGDQLTMEAREAVNELWVEQLIPFKLTAHKVDASGNGQYTVHFFDARLPSLFIYWNPEKGSFKAAVREVGKRTVGKRSRAKAAGQWQTVSS
jgi:hypothetical protein